MSKIIKALEPFLVGRTVKGTNFLKGDYISKIKLFPILTTDGIFNLDRNEVISLLAKAGKTGVKRITDSSLALLKGLTIDVSKIADK